jgi:hypothetical protein
MSPEASGQLLGYALQLPRALCYLLKSSGGDRVSVEVFGDVGHEMASNNSVIAEEDKSSISGNPVANRSVNLWKTFYNWATDIANGKLDIERTSFVLYVNNGSKSGFAGEFSDAANPVESENAVENALSELSDIDNSHVIWKYLEYLRNDNAHTLKKIVANFVLEIGSGAGIDEVKSELKKLYIPEEQVEDIGHLLLGWLSGLVMRRIYAKEKAIISHEEFKAHAEHCFSQVRRKELIDYASQFGIDKAKIFGQKKEHPIYVQQMEAVDSDDEDVLEAIADYLKADMNRQAWIEKGIIDEAAANDFESKLLKFWKAKRNSIEITCKEYDEKERGRLLLNKCYSTQVDVGGALPPSATVSGTYHALADKPRIGWHPNWKTLFLDA